MRTAKHLLFFFVMALSGLLNAQPAQAQSGVELENVQADVQFGQQILFTATIKASVPIQSVSIVLLDESQGLSRIEPLSVQPDGKTEYRLDTRQTLLQPFTNVIWHYQFTLGDGSTVQSDSFFVRYADDRFDWQSLESGTLQVNWYDGDAAFGQAALNTVQSGLQSASQLMALDLASPIDVYIYSNADDLRGTLVSGGEQWVAGHANPALGVVMVVVEPGPDQSIRMEQRIPHELMHVMMYRSVGVGYNNIPAWLREGTATLAEVFPNADYDRVLADAAAGNNLIPLTDLCVSFPADAGTAFLAYAEARSFTKYLHDTYGSTGLLNLAASYADGVDCERGTERAFNTSLSNLEVNWRSSALGQNAFLSALQNMAPYLVLLCLVLIIPIIGMLSAQRKKGKPNEPETFVSKR